MSETATAEANLPSSVLENVQEEVWVVMDNKGKVLRVVTTSRLDNDTFQKLCDKKKWYRKRVPLQSFRDGNFYDRFIVR